MRTHLKDDRGICEGCGLSAARHSHAGGCVEALRKECGRLRARLETVGERSSTEAIELRQLARFAGWALLAIGVLFISGTVLGHLAVARPVWELSTCRVFWGGLAAVCAGCVMLSVGHRRRRRRPARPASVLSLATPRHGFVGALGEARPRPH